MTIYYAYLAFASARATSGIWILYLLSRGLPLWEIGLLESAFHVTVLVSEVPTGYFADRIGYRTSLAAGAACGVAAALLFLAANSPLQYLGAFVLSALSWVLPSGADRALLFAMTPDAPAYSRLAAFSGGIRYVASAAGVLLGGVLTAIGGLRLPYVGEAAALFLALCATSLLPRGRGKRATRASASPPWRETLGAVRPLLGPIAAGALVFSAMNLSSLLLQPLLALRGAAAAVVAWSRGASDLAGGGGSMLVSRLRGQRARARLVKALPIGLALVFASLGSVALVPAIALMQLESVGAGAFETAIDVEQMPIFPEHLRATLFSLQSALSSAFVAMLFPLLGWLAGVLSYGAVFAVIGGLAALGALLWPRGAGVLAETPASGA